MIEPKSPGARFAVINMTRISGVGCVILGLLMANGRMFPDWPTWIAYVLIANGLVDVFVLPVLMARKWRTPK
jgi:ABC-type multidrug transport system permease subunit